MEEDSWGTLASTQRPGKFELSQNCENQKLKSENYVHPTSFP